MTYELNETSGAWVVFNPISTRPRLYLRAEMNTVSLRSIEGNGTQSWDWAVLKETDEGWRAIDRGGAEGFDLSIEELPQLVVDKICECELGLPMEEAEVERIPVSRFEEATGVSGFGSILPATKPL